MSATNNLTVNELDGRLSEARYQLQFVAAMFTQEEAGLGDVILDSEAAQGLGLTLLGVAASIDRAFEAYRRGPRGRREGRTGRRGACPRARRSPNADEWDKFARYLDELTYPSPMNTHYAYVRIPGAIEVLPLRLSPVSIHLPSRVAGRRRGGRGVRRRRADQRGRPLATCGDEAGTGAA